MNVTIYEGFNKNRGDYPLLAILNGIRNGRWSKTVESIREAIGAGDSDKADRLKKSLPAFTLSATYSGSRKKDSITSYSGWIMLDVDKLDADQVDPVVWKAVDCAYTVFCFRSPSGRGVKIGVDPLAAEGSPLVEHALTLENHKATFLACARYYEKLLGVAVDPSGKDPGRLCFVSYDSEVFVRENKESEESKDSKALKASKGVKAVKDIQGVKDIKGVKGVKGFDNPQTPVNHNACATLAAIKRIRRRTTSKGRYEEGNRNNYVFRFSCICCEENIPIEEALAYCRTRFKDLSDEELAATVSSGYHTVEEAAANGKNEKSEKDEKDEKRKNRLLAKTEDWLRQNYQFRFNVITRFIEFRPSGSEEPYVLLDDQGENSIWRALQHDGITIKINILHILLMSDFCPRFDPFRNYFEALPPWDGVTDHIRNLAETVEVDNKELWYRALRRFLVAMVASALDREVVNHTVLVLASEQGKGKTTWCLNIIPPELHAYRYSGIPDPRSKDTMDILSKNLLVNLDELGTLTMKELNPLKEMITKNVLHYRPYYGRNMEHHVRIASFLGSVNSTQVFADLTGSRRFASFEARRIDYLSPVDYVGVYSQVMALYREGFRFWLNDTEIEEMNINNETFRIRSPEEEIFHTWVRLPQADDTNVQYLTASQILAILCLKVPMRMDHNAAIRIGMILKKEGFESFFKRNRRLYAVVIHSLDEVNAENEKRETEQFGSNSKSADNE